MNSEYVFVDGRKLRCGFTTGTCAAAASKAAAEMLLTGKTVEEISITVPKGNVLNLSIENIEMSEDSVRCAVRKDGGDDIDATHGTLIYSTVTRTENGSFETDGGKGVGRVTRKGLDQPVGNAAINRVPRQMIADALRDAADMTDSETGLKAVIDVPEGEDIAQRTFNPNLGIIGGISILGTSGIVEPMSEKALVASIHAEMDMLTAEGRKILLFVPGNYGRDYSRGLEGVGSDASVKISNFLGEALDHALESEAEGVLLVGNIGKLVKVAGGIMNTHSRNADSRAEIMTAYSIMAGADTETAKSIMECATTEAALDILIEKGIMEETVKMLAERIEYHMRHRTLGKMKVGTVIFSSNHGRICDSESAPELLEALACR